MKKNLWGNLEELVNEVMPPKDILDEQAEFLKESLDGLVECKISRIPTPDSVKIAYGQLGVKCDFSFTFGIFSDYVEKYEYEICRLTYGIKMYPVAISFGLGIAEAVSEVFDLEYSDTIIVEDEEKLLSVMEKILSSREVRQVLQGLLVIAKKEKESQDCPF